MYTCPMHPNVVQDHPGHCPICGMSLVPQQDVVKHHAPQTHTATGTVTRKNYVPLIVVFSLIALTTLVLGLRSYYTGSFDIENSIINIMIGFFLVFGGFKLMDLKGFAGGYSTYDLLAQKWFGYGYLYPFIEVGFGLAMLAGIHNAPLLVSEFALMAFGGIGVSIKLLKHEPVQCACLGTFLKVPLTKITIFENFGMATLALVLLLLL